MKRAGWVGVGLAVVGLVLVLITRQSEDEDSSPETPTTGATTTTVGSGSGAVAEYLRGPGRLVMELLERSVPLAGLENVDEAERPELCQDVADELNDDVDPDALLEAAAGIPDEHAAELALDARRAVADLLATCIAGDADETGAALETFLEVRRLWDEEVGA